MEPHDERWTPKLEEAAKRRGELHDALVALEDAISGPAAGRIDAWRQAVAQAMHRLRDAFDEHVEVTEQQGGLYEEIIQRAPQFAGKVQRLHYDHPEIQELLRALSVRLEGDDLERGWEVDEAREEIQQLLGRIVRHRQKGSDLVWEAYNVDIGGTG
ncbi:MAG TPA: hemerythrin domain-containing protein [Actinomycetota bacterium]|nr:hemerythrin domain-containing protein [Actinomycetota bacterium]